MINRDDLPDTPDWIAQTRPAIQRLETRCCDGCHESAVPDMPLLWQDTGDQG